MGMDGKAQIAWGIDLSELSWELQEKIYSSVWDTRDYEDLEVMELGWSMVDDVTYILLHSDYTESTSTYNDDYYVSLDSFPSPPDSVVEDLKQCVMDCVMDNDDDDDIDKDDLDVKLHFGYLIS